MPAGWLDPAPATGWAERWRAASAAAADVVAVATDGTRTDGPSVARAVAAAGGPDDLLVVGSSSPVRDLGLVLGLDGPGPRVLANRGLAGIDGTVSTALGAALATGRGHRRTRALLGDLTFLHDVGGLLRGPDEPHADLQLVVVNDDGGAIFAGLEPGALGESSAGARRTFERVFATPHGAHLAPLCAGFRVDHQLVQDVPRCATPSRRRATACRSWRCASGARTVVARACASRTTSGRPCARRCPRAAEGRENSQRTPRFVQASFKRGGVK